MVPADPLKSGEWEYLPFPVPTKENDYHLDVFVLLNYARVCVGKKKSSRNQNLDAMARQRQ